MLQLNYLVSATPANFHPLHLHLGQHSHASQTKIRGGGLCKTQPTGGISSLSVHPQNSPHHVHHKYLFACHYDKPYPHTIPLSAQKKVTKTATKHQPHYGLSGLLLSGQKTVPTIRPPT